MQISKVFFGVLKIAHFLYFYFFFFLLLIRLPTLRFLKSLKGMISTNCVNKMVSKKDLIRINRFFKKVLKVS